ncbi:hypothetical protein [Allobranchiibius huperziae]|uniref:Rv3651-like N-terminal domain-containing protein n=1 Tax=Allobranchiibius huperziae TaxID=1874116 RepID=A0A853DIC6_9MICO|nr:hypothetical protein [Allobranchiibius huperziae]NYJ76528.1 hypothetical protein [Allobranchiibius huperziae]
MDVENEWVLIDPTGSLLAVGDTPYKAVSPQGILAPQGRRLLLPAIEEVIASGNPVEHLTDGVVVRALPIVTAKTGSLTAVHAIYRAQHEAERDRPIVGCWEWELENVHAERAIHIYWDDAMFKLYELDRTDPEFADLTSGATPMPAWLNNLIAFEHRAEMYTYLDQWIHSPGNKVPIFRYHIMTGRGEAQPSTKQLRFAGDGERVGDTLWLRGITHEAPEGDGHVIPDFIEVRSEDLLRAAFDLTDAALAAIDTRTWSLYMWSKAQWVKARLTAPGNGSLLNLLKLDDLGAVQSYLAAAAKTPAVAETPIVARFQTEAGDYEPFLIRASGVDAGTVKGRFVLCRITPG